MFGSILGSIASAVIGGAINKRQTTAYNQQSAANTASANEMSREIAREQMAKWIVTGKHYSHSFT